MHTLCILPCARCFKQLLCVLYSVLYTAISCDNFDDITCPKIKLHVGALYYLFKISAYAHKPNQNRFHFTQHYWTVSPSAWFT